MEEWSMAWSVCVYSQRERARGSREEVWEERRLYVYRRVEKSGNSLVKCSMKMCLLLLLLLLLERAGVVSGVSEVRQENLDGDLPCNPSIFLEMHNGPWIEISPAYPLVMCPCLREPDFPFPSSQLSRRSQWWLIFLFHVQNLSHQSLGEKFTIFFPSSSSSPFSPTRVSVESIYDNDARSTI